MGQLRRKMEISFQILSNTNYLSFVRELLKSLNLPSKIENKCSVALVEAIDNAIFHAHNGDETKPINISVSNSRKKVKIEVKDNGKGFDIDSVPFPNLYQINGRGLFIVKKLMSKVEYKNNTLEMWYYD